MTKEQEAYVQRILAFPWFDYNPFRAVERVGGNLQAKEDSGSEVSEGDRLSGGCADLFCESNPRHLSEIGRGLRSIPL